MKFGYSIIYVIDVPSSLAFFNNAFGIPIRFVHGDNYGELETGYTILAFAAHQLGEHSLPDGYVAIDKTSIPLGIEIALIADSVKDAYIKAMDVGAISVKDPIVKPWGQTVSYVRSPDGMLVELCSPINE